MTGELGGTGMLARITATSEDDGTVCFDLRNGKSGFFTATDGSYSIGDVILLTGDIENSIDVGIQRMPNDSWPEERWIGVVKIKLPDISIIDSSGRFREIPTVTSVDYDVGNTVQATDSLGVTRVLSETPIKYIDLPQIDDSVIGEFVSSQRDAKKLDFDDFGGMSEVVDRARQLIEIPIRYGNDLAEIGARAIKGVLFTGEPGTGKTMLARIIASQSGAVFYEISGPEIFSKWFGQSEELLRKLFRAAAKHEKAIIFFDEIDSVAARRDDHSHEASKRVVAQLLTLMDGFSSDSNVVVIAATNRPHDLDIALRRPGRFDWEIEFPIPDEQDRRDILEKTARNLNISVSLPHKKIATMSNGWTGAELAQIWTEAALLAVRDKRRRILEEDYIGGFEQVSRHRVRTGATLTERVKK